MLAGPTAVIASGQEDRLDSVEGLSALSSGLLMQLGGTHCQASEIARWPRGSQFENWAAKRGKAEATMHRFPAIEFVGIGLAVERAFRRMEPLQNNEGSAKLLAYLEERSGWLDLGIVEGTALILQTWELEGVKVAWKNLVRMPLGSSARVLVTFLMKAPRRQN